MHIFHNFSALIDDFVLFYLSKKARAFRDKSSPMVVFSHDFIGSEINVHGIYEHAELKAIISFLSNIDKELTVLDIGANIGNHTRFFYNQGFKKILSFEPHKVTYKLLELNTNSLSGVDICNYGLSDTNEDLQAIVPNVNAGGATISSDVKGEMKNIVTFTVKRFDDLEFSAQKIGLVKIDVEGHEVQAFKGMRKVIERDNPVILFEYNNSGEEVSEDIIKLLRSYGYNDFHTVERPASYIPKYFPKLLRMPLRVVERLMRTSMRRCSIVKVDNFKHKNYPIVIAH